MSCRIPLWLAPTFCIMLMALIVGLTAAVLLSLMEEATNAQLLMDSTSISSLMLLGATTAADSIIEAVRDASMAVDMFEPRLQVCGAPQSNHTGETLLRSLEVLPGPWLSLGVMQRSTVDPSTKWSWQMARGFGCPEHIYAYIDGETAPAFVGYCASLVPGGFNLSTALAYNGTDWGFTPLERQMLFDGAFDEAFTDVKPLLGVLEVSYRRLIRCPGADKRPFALVFASRTIGQLEEALIAERANASGVTFIVERTTGLMVAASVANQSYVDGGKARPVATNATNAMIREAASMLAGAASRRGSFQDRLFVSATPYAPARGIDWIVVVAIETDAVVAAVQGAAFNLKLASALVAVGAIIFAAIGSYVCITRPLQRIAREIRDRRAGTFDAASAEESDTSAFAFAETSDIREALLEKK